MRISKICSGTDSRGVKERTGVPSVCKRGLALGPRKDQCDGISGAACLRSLGGRIDPPVRTAPQ